MHELLHICSEKAWEDARSAGVYRAESLATEGFIHCSTREQVLIPANAMFAGRDDLVLLVIDADRFEADLVYEDCYDSGIEFPHIYGSIPVDAVVRVVDFPCCDDGKFTLPAEL